LTADELALAFSTTGPYNCATMVAGRMSIFARRSCLAIVLAVLCLGGRAAHAQAAPVTYWTPGWPVGFGGDLTPDQISSTYGNFPSFDGSRFSLGRYNFPSGWFVGGERGGMGLSLNGINRYGAFGYNSLYSEGVQFGYNFRNAPLTVFAGFDTLKYNPGIGGPSAPFDTTAGTAPGYGAHAGIAFQAAPNVSLSLGFDYTQTQSGRVDSDINSSLVPGATPFAFTSGRR
jgi:opacity protein-like surface antigen